MLYRLLRNNKESGPFTALQLKDMGLKPFDLLWAEGRGAAWQYASEIPELKSFAPTVEEQPFDRFFKRKEALQTAQQPAGVKKTKPRFRISNGQLIMIEAGNLEVANNGTITETAPVRMPKEPVAVKEETTAPDWQKTHSEWQPKLQAKAAKTEAPAEIETKYSESLDDLKKRYAEKVLNEKTAKPSSSISAASVKQNIMAAVALLVLAAGGYFGYSLKQKDAATATEGKPAVERADVISDNNVSPAQNDAGTASQASQNKASNSIPASVVKKTDDTKKSVSINAEKATETVVDKKKFNAVLPPNVLVKKEVKTTTVATNLPTAKPVDKSATASIKKVDGVKTNSSAATGKPLPQPQFPTASAAKNTSSNTATTTTTVPKPLVKPSASKNISDYLSVKKLGGSTASVQNVRLLVNNVTDFPIDLAVIDIQYFDSKGKYQKGETMYVKNIDGGNNVELRVPDSDKSSSIKYKISLVSSEKKTLYLVAD